MKQTMVRERSGINCMPILSLVMSTVLVFAMQGCDQTKRPDDSLALQSGSGRLNQVLEGVKKELVFVEGGTFLMGDYGVKYGPERLPYDRDSDSKPVHEVELSSFSIGKFKVTNAQYQYYLDQNGLKLRETYNWDKDDWENVNALPETPAHVDWYEAERYCTWLGLKTGLPFAMPTEAQWEYAARSRGQFLMVATDDGTYKAEPLSKRTASYSPKGINISTRGDRVEFSNRHGWKLGGYSPLPVDMFPPNPLRLYAMSDNGYEWVSDWYDPEYYSSSLIRDPQGPQHAVHKDKFGHATKVMRGQDVADPYWGGGINVHRTAQEPFARFGPNGLLQLANKTVRCVVNSPLPIDALGE